MLQVLFLVVNMPTTKIPVDTPYQNAPVSSSASPFSCSKKRQPISMVVGPPDSPLGRFLSIRKKRWILSFLHRGGIFTIRYTQLNKSASCCPRFIKI